MDRPRLHQVYADAKECQLTLVHPKVLRPMMNLKAALRQLPRRVTKPGGAAGPQGKMRLAWRRQSVNERRHLDYHSNI